jgi:hypothetical protein
MNGKINIVYEILFYFILDVCLGLDVHFREYYNKKNSASLRSAIIAYLLNFYLNYNRY